MDISSHNKKILLDGWGDVVVSAAKREQTSGINDIAMHITVIYCIDSFTIKKPMSLDYHKNMSFDYHKKTCH